MKRFWLRLMTYWLINPLWCIGSGASHVTLIALEDTVVTLTFRGGDAGTEGSENNTGMKQINYTCKNKCSYVRSGFELHACRYICTLPHSAMYA